MSTSRVVASQLPLVMVWSLEEDPKKVETGSGDFSVVRCPC